MQLSNIEPMPRFCAEFPFDNITYPHIVLDFINDSIMILQREHRSSSFGTFYIEDDKLLISIGTPSRFLLRRDFAVAYVRESASISTRYRDLKDLYQRYAEAKAISLFYEADSYYDRIFLAMKRLRDTFESNGSMYYASSYLKPADLSPNEMYGVIERNGIKSTDAAYSINVVRAAHELRTIYAHKSFWIEGDLIQHILSSVDDGEFKAFGVFHKYTGCKVYMYSDARRVESGNMQIVSLDDPLSGVYNCYSIGNDPKMEIVTTLSQNDLGSSMVKYYRIFASQ